MKKIMLLVLSLVMVICLCACGSDVATTETPIQENVQEVQQSKPEEKTEENTTVYAEDEFSFELVGYHAYPNANIINIDFKFRNITEKDIDRVVFSAQGLDANGDLVDDTFMSVDNISAGQAAWYTYQTNINRSCQTIEELSQKIHSIKIYSVYVEPEAYNFDIAYELDFKEPIVIVVADVEDKEVVANQ